MPTVINRGRVGNLIYVHRDRMNVFGAVQRLWFHA